MRDLKKEKAKKSRTKKRIGLAVKTLILLVLMVALGFGIAYLGRVMSEDFGFSANNGGTDEDPTPTPSGKPDGEQQGGENENIENLDDEQKPENERERLLAEAEKMAVGYDYDGAIALLSAVEGAELDAQLQKKISDYQKLKDACVPVNMNEVTHVFYHSLIVDPELGFRGDDSIAAGFKQWMTTVDEFNKITQEMYDNGYVLVRLRDLVIETKDENGNVHFVPNDKLLLPAGKKAYVMSMDDLSYYHSYDNRGIATKLVLDENGQPTCEYKQADGTVVTGAYDYVPLLDQFIAEHPDASYKGAKAMIALTGYNGILGYRTDIAYKTGENLTWDQKDWLEEHPDFDWDKECAEAKKVADVIKANGWEFASHTWGHVAVGSAGMERIKTDTNKWRTYVEPLVGEVDTIIFAHGEDIGSWKGYSEDNEKYQYFKSQGYNYFCNVDSTRYFLQIRDGYVRMGRRNLDGYRIWNDVHQGVGLLTDLFDASAVLDPKRTDMPPV